MAQQKLQEESQQAGGKRSSSSKQRTLRIEEKGERATMMHTPTLCTLLLHVSHCPSSPAAQQEVRQRTTTTTHHPFRGWARLGEATTTTTRCRVVSTCSYIFVFHSIRHSNCTVFVQTFTNPTSFGMLMVVSYTFSTIGYID